MIARSSGWPRLLGALLATVLLLALAAPARAERPLFDSDAVNSAEPPGGIEGACGIAFAQAHIYVSDYYHDAIDVFDSGGRYERRLPFPAPGGPCQLATAPGGFLYVNEWHESAARLLPSALELDSAESTGLAVDPSTGILYVDDRTYLAAYQPSGEPVLEEGEPLRIGLGSLGEGYGIAAAAGRVYVADAADHTVKVYRPLLDRDDPALIIDGAATPQGGFNSLIDAALAVDPLSGHLVVLDNLQPGFEHPEAVLDEFGEGGTFLGQVSRTVIDGEPSGLAFDAGRLYVTSGNSEGSTVLAFGAYGSASPGLTQPPPSASSQSAPLPSPVPTPALAAPSASAPAGAPRRRKHRRHRHRRSHHEVGGRYR